MPRCVPSCTARGGGSFKVWRLGRGLLIPVSPWKKLVTYKKMGDMAGGSGIFRVFLRFVPPDSSDSLGFLRFVCQIIKGP